MGFVQLSVRYPEAHEDDVLDVLAWAGAELIDADHGRVTAVVSIGQVDACRRRLATAGVAPGGIEARPVGSGDWGATPLVARPSVVIAGIRIISDPSHGGPGAGESHPRFARSARGEPRARSANDAPVSALRIEAGEAFGTGLHPTSRLCLDRIAEWAPEGALLDVGTGTGLLALFWLRRGGRRAVATDIDPVARAAALLNAERNGLGHRLRVTDAGADALGERFERVVANIVAAPLVALAPRLVQALAPAGRVLLSGFQGEQRDAVVDAYRHCGLRPSGEWTREGWSAVELSTPW